MRDSLKNNRRDAWWVPPFATLFITKSSVWQTIFFSYQQLNTWKKNLFIANKICQSLGPSMHDARQLWWPVIK